MCSHPYDYCGPTFDGCNGETCSPCYRAGSILAGTPDVPMSAAPVDEIAPQNTLSRTPTRAKTQFGDVPGSEQIVSITERVVEPAGGVSESLENSTSARTVSRPALRSDGWTARRPAYDEVRR